jgi:hypothetical protein
MFLRHCGMLLRLLSQFSAHLMLAFAVVFGGHAMAFGDALVMLSRLVMSFFRHVRLLVLGASKLRLPA